MKSLFATPQFRSPRTHLHHPAATSIAGSHKLFCVRPMPGEKGYLAARSTVTSPHVQLIIQAAVNREHDEVRKRFYKMISAHPHCRSVMGRLLEQQFHRWVKLDRCASSWRKKKSEMFILISSGAPSQTSSRGTARYRGRFGGHRGLTLTDLLPPSVTTPPRRGRPHSYRRCRRFDSSYCVPSACSERTSCPAVQ